jgi:hypothetical protein
VYELPLKEEQDAAQETATESDKKALVFCDLVTNVTEGPLNVRILGIVTGGNNPIVPWMPRYLDTLTLINIFGCLHTAHAPLHTHDRQVLSVCGVCGAQVLLCTGQGADKAILGDARSAR